LEDLFRLGAGSINYFIENDDNTAFSSRRKFVVRWGLELAAIPFMSLIYGITVGRYNYKVIKTHFFPDLNAFDGFTITQISDVHSGSFDNPEKISYAIDLVNEQNSDMILFTGDIVNTDVRRCILGLKRSIELKNTSMGSILFLGTMIMENMSPGQQR
jgi:hypothetical protein